MNVTVGVTLENCSVKEVSYDKVSMTGLDTASTKRLRVGDG
jgi:hypothetical protein